MGIATNVPNKTVHKNFKILAAELQDNKLCRLWWVAAVVQMAADSSVRIWPPSIRKAS